MESSMHRRQFTAGLLVASGLVCSAVCAAGVGEAEAGSGVRGMLERAAVAAVEGLGHSDGFLGNPKVRIPLPPPLEDAAKLLKATGQQKRVDELVTAMNRAAEAAMPLARAMLVNTVKSISISDAIQIVRGGDRAATDFFVLKTRAPLTEQFLPIVAETTEKVALAAKFNAVAGQAVKLGLLKGDDAKVERYVTAKALDGLYLMIAEEERKIRRDPLATGSAILRKVFGG